tara:strand:- start:100 stop:513 length:414 start_codon:yes stop_codon:yes gene_type:complete
MFTKLQEFFGVKKKSKYKAKNFTKSRINKNGHREVYDSSTDQWLLWIMIMDDTDYVVDFNSFEEVEYTDYHDMKSKSLETGTESSVSSETYTPEVYTPISYEPSSSSSSSSSYDSGSSYSSSSYDSGSSSSSSGGWD